MNKGIQRKTWLLNERPETYPPKYAGREEIHPPAKSWQEIAPLNKKLFEAAAIMLSEEIEPPYCAMGSRVIGKFIDSSDIDVAVLSTKKIGKFPIEVDGIKYQVNTIHIKMTNDHIIEIPYEKEQRERNSPDSSGTS